MLNLATVLESSARKSPGATAITFPGRSITYGETDALAQQVAAGSAGGGH